MKSAVARVPASGEHHRRPPRCPRRCVLLRRQRHRIL